MMPHSLSSMSKVFFIYQGMWSLIAYMLAQTHIYLFTIYIYLNVFTQVKYAYLIKESVQQANLKK